MENALDADALHKIVKEKQAALLKELRELIGLTDAENTFLTFVLFVTTRGLAQSSEDQPFPPESALIELAAFHLVPHFGNTQKRDLDATSRIIVLIEKLKELHTTELITQGSQTTDPQLSELLSHIQFYVEGIRGCSYISQTQEQIECIQGEFETWFMYRIGIGPRRAIQLIHAIQSQLTSNFESTRTQSAKTFSQKRYELSTRLRATGLDADICETSATFSAFVFSLSNTVADNFPVSREQLTHLENAPTEKEWNALIKLIGMTKEIHKDFQQSVDGKKYPLYILSRDRIVLYDLSTVLEELFSAFESQAKTDQKFFSGKYHKNQKEWMECQLAEKLKRVFHQNTVHTQLTYPNPDKPGDEAEIDAIVLWPPFLLLIEAKGKQFRLHKALKDPSRLRTDLKQNVQDAFDQSNRASRYLATTQTPSFFDKAKKQLVCFDNKRIHRILKISVTLFHLADLTTQLANLKPLQLFTEDEYPYSVSLADLDTITCFCEGPEVFLHYIQRRLDLQHSEKNIMADELDLFGTYLDNRLQPSLLWNRVDPEGKDFTLLCITGGSEKFDAWHDFKLGIRKHRPEIKLKIPEQIQILLKELRKSDDPSARWIAFALLSLTQRGMAYFSSLLQRAWQQKLPFESIKSILFVDESTLGIITVSHQITTETLHKTLFMRVSVEKYRRKLKTAFGFAINQSNPHLPFDFAVWNECEWKHMDEMEMAIKKMPPLHISNKPEPDAPCVCGSNKMFKDCCSQFS